MQIKILPQLFSTWSKQRRFVRRIKQDYRKAADMKLETGRLLPDEEDQLFIKVEREL